jgi:hypothetical protein
MCTTILVVMVTCIVQGMLMEPLIRCLGVPIGVDVGTYLKVRPAPQPGSYASNCQSGMMTLCATGAVYSSDCSE